MSLGMVVCPFAEMVARDKIRLTLKQQFLLDMLTLVASRTSPAEGMCLIGAVVENFYCTVACHAVKCACFSFGAAFDKNPIVGSS